MQEEMACTLNSLVLHYLKFLVLGGSSFSALAYRNYYRILMFFLPHPSIADLSACSSSSRQESQKIG